MVENNVERTSSRLLDAGAGTVDSAPLELELAKRYLTLTDLGDNPVAKVFMGQYVEALKDNRKLQQEVGDLRQAQYDYYDGQIEALKKRGGFLNILLFLAGALLSFTPYFWEKGELLRGGLVVFFALSIAAAEAYILREGKKVSRTICSQSPRGESRGTGPLGPGADEGARSKSADTQ